MSAGRAASIHARLLARARATGEDFNLVLNRYATERFLYRLSQSPVRDAFVLKGALLFDLWFDNPHRPTRDADFLDDLPAPSLRVYPRATVMAEKLEAIVSIGMANSRMKDYYDLLALAREGEVAGPELAVAIEATFRRRGTAIPEGTPIGLSEEFSRDVTKLAQWRAFLGKNRLDAPALASVVVELREYFALPLAQVRRQQGAR